MCAKLYRETIFRKDDVLRWLNFQMYGGFLINDVAAHPSSPCLSAGDDGGVNVRKLYGPRWARGEKVFQQIKICTSYYIIDETKSQQVRSTVHRALIKPFEMVGWPRRYYFSHLNDTPMNESFLAAMFFDHRAKLVLQKVNAIDEIFRMGKKYTSLSSRSENFLCQLLVQRDSKVWLGINPWPSYKRKAKAPTVHYLT